MPAPPISVVVPVHRQWEFLPTLLAALAAQTVGEGDFEAIVVNNEAPLPPPPLALPANARLIDAPAPGAYAARNAGAAAGRGRPIAFTDADCRPDPGWLAALAAAAAAHPGALLAGPVRVIAPLTPNAFAIYDMVRGIPQTAYVARGYGVTANLAVPAEIFRALGGFDAAAFSGGDARFCRRAAAAGHRVRLVPGATVGHACRTSWEALATKARRIKGGQVAAGPLPRRLAWTLRTLAPPLRESFAFLRAGHPPGHRLTAVVVRFRLWGVELAETARLLAGGAPERR